MSETFQTSRRILISGASIAGPTLAYWLDRAGFEVTVVEKAAGIRGGGYPIDVRGTALEVVERMGLLPRLRAAHIHSAKITFVDREGQALQRIRPEALTGGEQGSDLEIPRGELTESLYALTRNRRIRYHFADSIVALAQSPERVDVTFASGRQQSFGLVIGCDGLHSQTRRLLFGPEQPFLHYLGYCFAGFSMPNDLGLSHESMIYARPGRAAVLSVVGDQPRLHAFLNFATGQPPELRELEAQRRLTAEMLQGSGWIVPQMLAAMLEADDFYFDSVSQIRLPAWSSGRVVLAGDAAHAPSFLSGQGTSLALVGAYVLAGELARHAHYAEAFAAYERMVRPFAEANQALAQTGGSLLLPASEEQLARRNQALADLSAGETGLPGEALARQTHSALQLPDYAGWGLNSD